MNGVSTDEAEEAEENVEALEKVSGCNSSFSDCTRLVKLSDLRLCNFMAVNRDVMEYCVDGDENFLNFPGLRETKRKEESVLPS